MENQEELVEKILRKFSKLPRFPDGRIDYSNSDKALVLTCFVKYGNKILLLKRSEKVNSYRGKWSAVAGFIDEPKSIEEKLMEELKEEIGILKKNILKIRMGELFEVYDDSIKKTWIILPVLAELKSRPVIKLDWEHTDFKWITSNEMKNYDTDFKLEETLRKVLK
jgi:ADP-ribose pyrophosphatase YjhB (NUDIX family)